MYVCPKCETCVDTDHPCPCSDCGTLTQQLRPYFKGGRSCVCHVCKVAFTATNASAGCPKCGGPIQLEGFYRRTQPSGVRLRRLDVVVRSLAHETHHFGRPVDFLTSTNVGVPSNCVGAAYREYTGDQDEWGDPHVE